MELTQRDIEIFKLLTRYRYLRRTFIHALLATPLDDVSLRRRIYKLSAHKYLREPERQQQSKNYRYVPRVHELGARGYEELKYELGLIPEQKPVKAHEFWHELMICDILASIEIGCMYKGLTFQILDKPSELTTPHGALRADAYFSINGMHFLVEADRATESNTNRWQEKIDKYTDVFKTRSYQTQWNIQSLIVLCMFSSPQKADNVRLHIQDTLGKKSRSLWFRGMKILGSHDRAPKPLTNLPDELWHRAGHEPVTILSALN
jgi:hypothetical protein